MKIADWAKINNLTPKEFTKEILTLAAVVGTMEIDKQDNEDFLIFSCEDNIGKIKITISREINDDY